VYRANQDVRVARRVAEVCKQRHQVIVAGQEFLVRFPHYAERPVYLSDSDAGRKSKSA
jgi:asparagine synthase (glutamine-hydrolysing)